jgi:Raffinose synthase or seed imbibition protein Sip1
MLVAATSKLVTATLLVVAAVQYIRVLPVVVVVLLLLPFHVVTAAFVKPSFRAFAVSSPSLQRIQVFGREEDTAATTAVPMNSGAMTEKVALQQGRFGTLWQLSLAPCLSANPPSVLRCGEDARQFACVVPLDSDDNNDSDDCSVPTVNDQRSILCLHRFKIWWMQPQWVPTLCQIPAETLLILYQTKNGTETEHGISSSSQKTRYHLLLAVPLPIPIAFNSSTGVPTNEEEDETTSASATNAARWTFATSSLQGGNVGGYNRNETDSSLLYLCSNHHVTALYTGQCDDSDPYALIRDGVDLAAQLWRPTVATTISDTTDGATFATDKDTATLPTTTRHDTGTLLRHTLGWCTWNAMYTQVTGRGLVDAVQRLQGHCNIPIRWMIVDDGWQDTTSATATSESDSGLDLVNGQQWSRRLKSMREDVMKFPSSLTLKDTVAYLRRRQPLPGGGSDVDARRGAARGGLDAILVWHTLAGYWLGMQVDDCDHATTDSSQPPATDRPLPQGRLYYPAFPRGILDHDPSASDEASLDYGVGIPDNADQFYRRYHDYLVHHVGVDGVKVDAQAVTGILYDRTVQQPARTVPPDGRTTLDDIPPSPPSLALQSALAQSALSNFATTQMVATLPASEDTDRFTTEVVPVIHCMAHSPEIFFRLPGLHNDKDATTNGRHRRLPLLRVADDYYPDNEASHGAQIVACACNSLLLGHLAVPDWDMLTSTLTRPEFVQMHAIAKSLSGGPIYLSDNPNGAVPPNRTVVQWLCCVADGTTFPCRGAALPLESSLLVDPLAPPTLLGEPTPFVIWNTNGNVSATATSGTVGMFCLKGSGRWDSSKLDYSKDDSMTEHEESLRYRLALRPSDIPAFATSDYRTVQFLLVGFFTDLVQVVGQKEPTEFELGYLQSESVVTYPIFVLDPTTDVVALGMPAQINGAGAVQSIERDGADKTIRILAQGCGTFVLAVRSRARTVDAAIAVQVNGISVLHSTAAPQSMSPLKCDTFRAMGFDLISFTLPPFQASHDVVVSFGYS